MRSRPRRCRRDLMGEEEGEEATGAGDGDGVEVGIGMPLISDECVGRKGLDFECCLCCVAGACSRMAPGEGSVDEREAERGGWGEGEVGELETESLPRRCRRGRTGEEKGEGTSGTGDGVGVGVGTRRAKAGVRGRRQSWRCVRGGGMGLDLRRFRELRAARAP